MPHLSFHVQDGTRSPDQDGSDVTDFDDARRQALHMAGVMLQGQGLGFSPMSPLSIEVADESGSVVFCIQVGLVYPNDPEQRLGDRLSSQLT